MQKKQDKTEFKPKGKYFQAIGRRKRSTALVRLYSGKGTIYINSKQIEKPQEIYLKPLKDTNNLTKFDISIIVKGGGRIGQIEAIRLGISRALLKYNDQLKQTLKKEGYLTRDPREKERKKPGLKRARKAPQWQKR